MCQHQSASELDQDKFHVTLRSKYWSYQISVRDQPVRPKSGLL